MGQSGGSRHIQPNSAALSENQSQKLCAKLRNRLISKQAVPSGASSRRQIVAPTWDTIVEAASPFLKTLP